MSKFVSKENLEEIVKRVAKKEEGVFFVEGLTTTAEGVWSGTNNRITSYYDGLVVNFRIGVAGSSDGTTLNINGLGAKTCYLRGTTKITTHYAVGTMVLFTYSEDADAFYSGDYDANNYAYARQYGNVTTDSNFPILFSKSATVPSTYTNNYTSSQSGFTYNPSTKTLTATNIKGTTLYENGTSLANKYLGKTAKASDSSKLNGQEASYYLNYNNLSNKPSIPTGTIPTKTSQLTNDSGFVTSSGSVNYATTSGGAAYLMQEDTRSENYIPAHYITYKYHSAILEFKSAATIGLGNTTFAVLQTFTPWSDSSGGRPHQLAFSDGGSVYHRMATSDSAWGDWERYINANWGYSGSSGYGSLSTSESTILTISSNTMGRFYSVSLNTYSSSSVGADIFVRYGSTSGTVFGGNTTASSGTPSSSALVSQIQMSTNARHNTKTLCFFVPPNTTAYVRGKSSASINYTYYYTYVAF